MAIRLGERAVKSVPALATGSFAYGDDEVTGFGVRVFTPNNL
jgi:hypothetical protein